MATTPDLRGRAVPERRVRVVTTPITLDSAYGGLVTRTLAGAIDAAIINVVALGVAAVVALVLSIFPVGHDTKALLAVVGGALFAIWAIAYFVTLWTGSGQTVGDRMMRIRVVRTDGTPLRTARALLRLAGAVLGLILFLGYIPILLTDRRRAFHDWLADTVVTVVPETVGSPR
jgi:uncharacterized RDD family membrane protein YckC